VIASHWKKYVEGCDAAGRPLSGHSWRVTCHVVAARSNSEALDRMLGPKGSNYYYYFEYLWKVLLAFREHTGPFGGLVDGRHGWRGCLRQYLNFSIVYKTPTGCRRFVTAKL
jgi:hypothetical protein